MNHFCRGKLGLQHFMFRQKKIYFCFDHAELFYWQKEQSKGSAEVDYIIQEKSSIIPIEVKAGKSGRLKSLHIFMREKAVQLLSKFHKMNTTMTANYSHYHCI